MIPITPLDTQNQIDSTIAPAQRQQSTVAELEAWSQAAAQTVKPAATELTEQEIADLVRESR
ncbi:MAG: hypothetical protein LCH79_12845 [Proteobacteria bacterium]|uniref:hypothetical protein n=1 Tax=Diaphorobacter nitroreducens TaxID=164759 RepID=UPI0035B01DC7|nr:hypothetical protein [Pseudomonadota bacterium]